MSETIKYSPRTELKMPEYGRNIQQMVQYCTTIEDRAERTRCAKTIIDVMGNLFPYLRDVEGFKHKLWDHLAYMSDYKLDIDYPYEIMQPDQMNLKPAPIDYSDISIKYVHYGVNIQRFIDYVISHEDIKSRDELIIMIATQMKKSYITWNRENVSDQKIFNDLYELSGNTIRLNTETTHLPDFGIGNNSKYSQQRRNNNAKNQRKK